MEFICAAPSDGTIRFGSKLFQDLDQRVLQMAPANTTPVWMAGQATHVQYDDGGNASANNAGTIHVRTNFYESLGWQEIGVISQRARRSSASGALQYDPSSTSYMWVLDEDGHEKLWFRKCGVQVVLGHN